MSTILKFWGAVNIDSEDVNPPIYNLLKIISERLHFRSIIGSKNTEEAELENGLNHGASENMMLRVLNKEDNTIGLIKIIRVNETKATAQIISGSESIEIGFRVEEVKKDEK